MLCRNSSGENGRGAACPGSAPSSAVPTCFSKSRREYSLRVRVRCLDRHLAEIVGTALVHWNPGGSVMFTVHGEGLAEDAYGCFRELVQMQFVFPGVDEIRNIATRAGFPSDTLTEVIDDHIVEARAIR